MRKVLVISAFTVLGILYICGCQSAAMTSAKVYLQQKDYINAFEQLRVEIQQTPTNAEAYFLAGQVAAELDSIDLMVRFFAEAEKLDTTYIEDIAKWRESKSGEAFNKGMKAWNKKEDADKAIEWTKISLNIDPKNTGALKNLAFFYQQKSAKFAEDGKQDSMDYYEELRFETYKKAYEIDSKDDEVIWILAGLYTEQGNSDKALEITEPVLESSEEPKVYFAAADAYDAKDNKEKALQMLTRAEQLDPENAELLFDIGVRYFKMDNFNVAADYFVRAYEKEPDNIEALYNYSLALTRAGKFAEAEKPTIELVKKNPEKTEYWGQLSNVWVQMGKVDEGKKALDVFKALNAGNNEEAQKNAAEVGIDFP